MPTNRPPGSVVIKHITEDIDQVFADSLLAVASSHLGSAVQVLHRVSWGVRHDADNWSVLALVVSGSYAALVEHHCSSDAPASVEVMVFPLANINSFSVHEDRATISVLGFDSPVPLPTGTLASELFNIR